MNVALKCREEHTFCSCTAMAFNPHFSNRRVLSAWQEETANGGTTMSSNSCGCAINNNKTYTSSSDWNCRYENYWDKFVFPNANYNKKIRGEQKSIHLLAAIVPSATLITLIITAILSLSVRRIVFSTFILFIVKIKIKKKTAKLKKIICLVIHVNATHNAYNKAQTWAALLSCAPPHNTTNVHLDLKFTIIIN